MLETLKLTNVALFASQTISFENGFNCLLGETGAGKSIIIDALSFVIGAKSDKLLIRDGEDFCRVEGAFSNLNEEVVEFLASVGIENDDVLIISRTLNLAGRNDIRINGALSSLSILKDLGGKLVSLYGQHENLMLLNEKNHLKMLDSFDESKTISQKAKLKDIITSLGEIDNKIKQLGGDESQRERELDIITYSINEIEKANLKKGEDEELEKNILKMSSVERIAESLSNSISFIDDSMGSSVLSNLRGVKKELSNLMKFDEKFDGIAKRLEEDLIDIDDIYQTLKEEKNGCYFDSNFLESMIEREQLIKKLKRKYGETIDSILISLKELKQKKDSIENADYEISKLDKQKNLLLVDAKSICENITQEREKMAELIEKDVVEQLASLGMKNTTFKISIKHDLKDFDKTSFSANGWDEVKFLFSANLGQDLKSLAKTISGGEMSRFMLAIKNVFHNDEGMMVFDEVDAGISGQIAICVAEKLAILSKNSQVLCISHLPQVCSMADHFHKVSKYTSEAKTYSKVELLAENDIVNEIAGMSYGEKLTGSAVDFARDLIFKNNQFKKSITE